MNKLYTRIDWENNTTPALNETNLNLMSKGIDDIDDRVVYLANEVIGDTTAKMNTDGSNAANAVTFPGSLTTGGNITDGNGNVLSNKMETDGSNAASEVTFANAFTVGTRASNSTVGTRSISFGHDNVASGTGSYAEGYTAEASGNYSHAEGYDTTASGSSSHAEGEWTTSSGNVSHAEGLSTYASGRYSHAEGRGTVAYGDKSHAEGFETYAAAENSHVEGSHTRAGSASQHVQGKYNIEDTNDTYAHIVGGGTSDNDRANIETLDWSGNLTVAGNMTDGNGNVLANKAENTIIATVEDEATASKAYAVGEHFIKNGAFCTCISAIAQGGTLTLNTNYTAGTVASNIEDINANLSANNAGSHNAIYRGKSLGSGVTAAQYSAISAGTFEDLYIGDYWTINGKVYRIAAFDYWLRTGNTECTTHHVVIVPDTNLYYAKMNDTDTTAGGYVGSAMYTTNLASAKSTINSAFGSSHILTHRELLTNAVTDGKISGRAWYDSTVELMNESMVYGHTAWESTPGSETGIDKAQLPLFALEPGRITTRVRWWLRGVWTSTGFTSVTGYGDANADGASGTLGVRPVFAIK